MSERLAEETAPKAGVFGAIFETLGASDNPSELRTKKSRFTLQGVDIFAGRDFDGYPHLLIPTKALDKVVPESLSAYIQLTRRELATGTGELQAFIDISCASTEADALFGPICLEISENISKSGASSYESVHAQVATVVDKWREILKALVEAGLSRSAVIGLIGEVLALAALIEVRGPEALDGWFGQEKTRHDFEFEAEAFEIKASTVLSRRTCEIHGMNQLASADGTTLSLIHFQIEQASNGLCLADLLKELEGKLGSNAVLRKKLLDFWPLAAKQPSWFSEFKFKVVSASRFVVDDTFPRIKPNALGTWATLHISDIRYTLNLEGIKAVALETGSSWMKVVN
jgi:hypothetical protein